MGLFDKMKEPIFLKKGSSAELQIEKLKVLRDKLNDEGKSIIDKDIKCLEYGIVGEENIAFELKNSHLPMYIMQDIYIEDGELSAQIDYVIVTRKLNFVIECKNLYGNIDIDNEGNFKRSMNFGGKWIKEGIYSPITQNRRHLDLIKKIKRERNNKVIGFFSDLWFDENYRSIVVLANPKTILNMKFAKKEIKNQVIKADQLINYIKDEIKKSNNPNGNDKDMLQWANSILSMHKDVEKDYIKKYENYIIDDNSVNENNTYSGEINTEDITNNITDSEIYKELKAFRINRSRNENVKPYFVFNNKQLEEIIEKMPENANELLSISGFGNVKVEKYGEGIFDIVKKYKYGN